MSLFLPILKRNGLLEDIHMTVCNVGSRKLGEHDDYASQGWHYFIPNLSIYGFDADADACDEANADIEARQINWKEQHIPIALGRANEERILYVTKHPMCSSLYAPNEPYLARMAGLPELVNLDFSFGIETTTLDDFCKHEGIQQIDFLQIDVQGADLDVLEGAREIINAGTLAVQIEVEFSHLYKDQPLFSDVDSFLRKHKFSLFDLSTSYRLRARSPIRSSLRQGQLLWADAFYFWDLLSEEVDPAFKTPDNLLKSACIADILSFPDYTIEILEYITLNYGDNSNYNFADSIIESLSGFPDLVSKGLGNLPLIINIWDYVSAESKKVLSKKL
ncbi:MAG: FkbM family methyltransferase [Pseudanabaenaceae cyanobacterium bins.68]|nr:FkbM family methyltransferase [Pseudanabaenaceae cyanobacterium bins.68]